MEANDIVIVSEVRTAVGSFGGSLKGILTQDLGAPAIKETVTQADISPEAVGEVTIGQVGQIAEDRFMGRAVSLKAGPLQETMAYSMNRQCGSGLQVTAEAVIEIQTGQTDICVVCGTENISRLSCHIEDARWGTRMGHKVSEDETIDILTWPLGPYHSGATVEDVAEQYYVSGGEQDAFVLGSHRRAVRAVKASKLKDGIVPVKLEDRKRSTIIFDTGEGLGGGLTIEKLQKLRPCFVKGGTVTVGDAPSLDDGVGVVVIILGEGVKEPGCKPLLIIKGYAVAGNDGAAMGYALELSGKKLAAKLGLDLTSIDMVEINEVFASQAHAVRRGLGLDPERTNMYGGEISIGHPIGATGVILAIKVMYEPQRIDKRDIMVSMCTGRRQGMPTYSTKPEQA